MKNTLLKVLFIFSLVINAAVAFTMGWHLWVERRPHASDNSSGPVVGPEGFRQMRNMMAGNDRSSLMQTRRRIQEKKLEVLDLIAKNPGDINAADHGINELIALKGQMERDALARIGKIMTDLPEEKRLEFLNFLKNRTCRGPGMGFGRGRRPDMGPTGSGPSQFQSPRN